jgi:hypothetical protein
MLVGSLSSDSVGLFLLLAATCWGDWCINYSFSFGYDVAARTSACTLGAYNGTAGAVIGERRACVILS